MSSRLNTDNGFWNDVSRRQVNRSHTKGCETLDEELQHNETLRAAWITAKRSSPSKSIDKIALYCYSLDDNFYIQLNYSIREWYEHDTDADYPFNNYVGLLMQQVNNYDQYLTLYRGVPFDTQLMASVGNVVYTNQFESCSLLRNEAAKFAKCGTLYIFKTKSAIPICEYSKFPYEKEYLIPPELEFVVKDVKPRSAQRSYFEVTLEMSAKQYQWSQRLV